MRLLRSCVLPLLCPIMAVAQGVHHPLSASRGDASPRPRPFIIAADTVDILGVMVQFQQDNSPLTSGDGRFDLSIGAEPVIDAPPHDRQYFLDHFTFVANYFRKSSRGKVIIRTTLLDSVITLPSPMETYSPPRTGSTIAVGNLALDAWRRVDSLRLVSDYTPYECFVLLHAGTGRDVDLISLLGYDPTPKDIPSLYLGLSAFREYYGSSFPGIAVAGGTFHITNTVIIPETESRPIPSLGGTVLLELSINGLLCASVGNFLGLPDLFDTNTGRSGIGRFGLMDGQAIFSFKGVFPPEPSAWEKYWLGWLQPVTLQAGAHTVSLPAVSVADTVFRVPIGGQEYFLLENRNRDPQRNGQKVYSRFRGLSRQQIFLRDTAGFNAFEIDSLAGVVTDVEDFDWSLPGGVDQAGRFYDGGALIWHIDEAVIAEGLRGNGVNANPSRRGVDLEEADGSQDIGEQYGFLSAGSGSEEGTPLDFWYEGNSSPVNKNIFSPTSYPDSRSSTGANSHVTIRNFSARSPRMTATVSIGDAAVSPLPGFPKLTDRQLCIPALAAADLTGDGSPEILAATTAGSSSRPSRVPGAPNIPARILAWRSDGTPALPREALAVLQPPAGGFSGAPAVGDLNGDGTPEVVLGDTNESPSSGGNIRAYSARPRPGDSLAAELFRLPVGREVLTSPVIGDSVLAFGGGGGRVYFVGVNGSLIDSLQWLQRPGANVAGVSLLELRSASLPGSRFLVTGSDGTIAVVRRSASGGPSTPDRSRFLGKAIVGPAAAGVVGSFGLRIACVTADGSLYVLDQQLNDVPGYPVSPGGRAMMPPAFADIDGDGVRDVVFFSGKSIHAYNAAGASLDYFPRMLSSGEAITSHPVVADCDGDGFVEVVAVTGDGLVAAYNREGKMPPGFPLQAGSGDHAVAVIDAPTGSLSTTDIGLVVASPDDGSVAAWRTGTIRLPYDRAKVRPWAQYQNDPGHSGLSVEVLQGVGLSSEFFPASRAYNWPNPVYDGKTFIRYYVRESAAVGVTIFDLAGDLVTTIPNAPGVGGLDNEVVWDVSGVQSGIYFARIEASGAGGSGVAVIKIAVVK